ncbi:MAG: phosphomethylpyrimidine synthase ThiC, partial [Petrotogales bacterium]
IAAHAADLARGIGREQDKIFSKARGDLNWKKMFELCIDPSKAKRYREEKRPSEDLRSCSMCGKFCAIELINRYLKGE